MLFHLVKLISWALLSSRLLDYYAPLARVDCARTPNLPDSLRAQTQLVYVDATRPKLFKVDEFISRSDGSIRLDVTDHSNGSGWEQAIETTYFRLFQGTNQTNNHEPLDISMVSLDLRTGECRTEHTTSWMLSDYSFLLDKLAVHLPATNDETARDRVSIGPTALLQMVYANPTLFRLDSRAYEDILMADAYYFSLSLDKFHIDSEPSRPAKLIVAVLADRVKFAANMSSGSEFSENKSKFIGTPLSEVNLSEHPAMVALVSLSGGARDNKLKSFELLRSLRSSDWPDTASPRMGLIVSYDLIRTRSLSRHSGLEQLSDELANPFQLSTGCGMLTMQRPLYINARQFSGQFEALGFEHKFAVAYDQWTNHLRYDSPGEFKLIYSLSEQLATFVSVSGQSSGGLSTQADPGNKSQESTYYHQAHQNKERCAQTNIVHERGNAFGSRSWLFDKNSLADILGLGDGLGLMYLGQKRLPADEEDELILCQVFEREVSAAQIPALLGMHTRNDLNTRDRRLYLVFYLVDEVDAPLASQPEPWQSMWLKRVELISIDPERRYQLVAARLSFSSFSWSLDSVETADSPSTRHIGLTHPARTFDTLECWSERGQLQVHLLLKRVDVQEWDEALKAGARLKSSLQMLSSLEETLLLFLQSTLLVPRSQINDLDIFSPASQVLHPEHLDSDMNNSLAALGDLWVSFKITKPFNYLYKSTFMGWVESYVELLRANQAKVVKYRMSMAKHECSSRLVTQLGQAQSIHMLYCPNIGCAYLTVDKLEDVKFKALQEIGDSDSVASNEAPFEDSFQMCEIHHLVKTMSMREIESDVYTAEVIKRYLLQSSLMIYAPDENYETAQQPYRAHVTKLSLLDGASRHDGWDQEVIYGLCFSVQTSLESGEKPYGDRLRVIQLDFDRNHSRAHCRRACLLYQFCQTYSYRRASRQCTLTSIHPRYFLDSKFNRHVRNLDSSSDCAIYALDHAVLYKRSSRIETKMPAELVADKSLLLFNLTLTECASLCHMDEFAVHKEGSGSEQTPIDCQSFSYLSLSSLCVLKNTGQEFDYRRGLVRREEHLAGPEELEARLGGKQRMYEPSACESYTRYYASHFASRYGIKIYLNGPMEHEDGWLDDSQPEKVLKGLGPHECQRECAMLDEDCAALDHCLVNEKGIQLDSQPRPAGRLFKKFQLEAQNTFVQQLTHDEKLFYLEGQSNKHELVIHSRNCHHFYLDGDNLHLKRLLAKSARNYLKESSMEQLVKRDASTSRLEEAFLESIEYPQDRIHLKTFTGELHTLSKICLGILVGLLVFLVQARVVEMSHKIDLIRSLRSIRWFISLRPPAARPRTDRTMSMADIVELADVDSP